MSDTERLVNVCSAYGIREVNNSLTFDDTKLQTLDRRVGAEQLYFGKEWFEKSLDAWEGIPLIFNASGAHPSDFRAVAENPEKAARDIGGKYVGAVRHPRIVLEGGARLMATLEIIEDEQEIYRLWQAGKLFPSTAFSVMSDGDKITSAPIPNHVLLFPEKKDIVQAGDFGAYVNSIVVDTSEEKPMADEEITAENAKKKKCMSFYDKIVEALKSVFTEDGKPIEETNTQETNTPEVKQVEEQTEVVETETSTEVSAEITQGETPVQNTQQTEEQTEEITQQENTESVEDVPPIDEKDAQIDALNSRIAELESKLAEQANAEQEKKFTEFMNSFVPEGMKATKEQRAALREKYDSDVVSLMFSIKAETDKASAGETARIGEQYAVTNTNLKAYCSVGDLCKQD